MRPTPDVGMYEQHDEFEKEKQRKHTEKIYRAGFHLSFSQYQYNKEERRNKNGNARKFKISFSCFSIFPFLFSYIHLPELLIKGQQLDLLFLFLAVKTILCIHSHFLVNKGTVQPTASFEK